MTDLEAFVEGQEPQNVRTHKVPKNEWCGRFPFGEVTEGNGFSFFFSIVGNMLNFIFSCGFLPATWDLCRWATILESSHWFQQIPELPPWWHPHQTYRLVDTLADMQHFEKRKLEKNNFSNRFYLVPKQKSPKPLGFPSPVFCCASWCRWTERRSNEWWVP